MRPRLLLLLLSMVLVVACGCACSTTWLKDCQPDTEEERCIVTCPHPNTMVRCGEHGEYGGDAVC